MVHIQRKKKKKEKKNGKDSKSVSYFLGLQQYGFSAKEENCSYYGHIRNIEKEAQTGDANNSHNWSSFYRGDHRELRRQCSSYWQAWEPRFQTRSNPILVPGIAPKFFILS